MRFNKNWLGLFVFIVITGLLAWLYQRKRASAPDAAAPDIQGSSLGRAWPAADVGGTHSRVAPPSVAATAAELGLPTGEIHAEPYAPDDLTAINGIGPVYAARLQDAGIVTFAQLAAANEATLAAAIAAPDWRRPDFGSWIAQAQARLDQ